MTVYDKASWHYPENCSDLEDATRHLGVLLEWLHEHDLLSKEGKEILELGVDEETSVTSRMLTDTGKEVMDRTYDDWLGSVEYGATPHTDALDSALNTDTSELEAGDTD